MWLTDTLCLLGGLVVLAGGGELLVRGAARLARLAGVGPLVIGLTVVAFGTSAPEAGVTVYAAAQDRSSLAVGNVVGSNIANILLILGLAAILSPLAVARSLIRVDGPIMILSALLLTGLIWTQGRIGRVAGILFLLGLVAYTVFTYAIARRDPPPADMLVPPLSGRGRYWWYNILFVVAGVGGLVLGARLIVDGATGLAQLLGVSEHVIGLTIVAVGTSLPELATTLVAARHKQPDIAIGNVVGSNIFNVFFVTGLAACVRPLSVPAAIVEFDGPLMLVVCLLFYPLAYTGRHLGRREGALLLALYAGYLAWTGAHAAA